MRKDLEQYKIKTTTELFDKIKELKELNNVQFALEKERKRTTQLISELQDYVNENNQKQNADSSRQVSQLREDTNRQITIISTEMTEMIKKTNRALKNANTGGGGGNLEAIDLVNNNVKGLATMFQHYIQGESEE